MTKTYNKLILNEVCGLCVWWPGGWGGGWMSWSSAPPLTRGQHCSTHGCILRRRQIVQKNFEVELLVCRLSAFRSSRVQQREPWRGPCVPPLTSGCDVALEHIQRCSSNKNNLQRGSFPTLTSSNAPSGLIRDERGASNSRQTCSAGLHCANYTTVPIIQEFWDLRLTQCQNQTS